MDNKEKCRLAFVEAESFFLASSFIYDNIWEKFEPSDRDKFFGLHNVAFVNHAFAVEIYLKCLQIMTTGNYTGGHVILDIFTNLPKEVKSKIINCYHKKYFERDFDSFNEARGLPQQTFIELLSEVEQPFLQFRYIFENKEKENSRYKLTLAILAVREIILEYTPEFKELIFI